MSSFVYKHSGRDAPRHMDPSVDECKVSVVLLGHMKRRHRRIEKRPPFTSFDCDGLDGSCDHSYSPSFPPFMTGMTAIPQLLLRWRRKMMVQSTTVESLMTVNVSYNENLLLHSLRNLYEY